MGQARRYFDQFTLNGPYTYKNLSLFSIQSSQKEQNSYMCLGDENLKNFTVSEKQQAEVPYILISNKNLIKHILIVMIKH